MTLQSFNKNDFIKLATECIDNLEKIKTELLINSAPLREKARLNAKLAIELLNER